MENDLSENEYEKSVAEIQAGIDSFKNDEGESADAALESLAKKLNIRVEVEINED